MKSLFKKRLPGILLAGLLALAVGAAGVTPAAASDATVSGLTGKQKKKRAKELKACKKKKVKKARQKCIKKVKKKYAKLAKPKPPKGKTKVVMVNDDYYQPNMVDLKVNDSIKWDWKNAVGSEGHNVSLFQGPAGVSPLGFESPIEQSPFVFTRKFTVPGQYHFVCSLHTLMRMDVKVTR